MTAAQAPAPLGPSLVADLLAGLGYDPESPAGLRSALDALVGAGLDGLPLPGQGSTRERWQVLAAVAAHDVALVKLVEGHTDALAILAELDGPTHPPGSTWGMWASEAPDAQLLATPEGFGGLRLDGRKGWCSGASVLSHGLLTCRGTGGERWLAAVALAAPGVTVAGSGWEAVGMAPTGTVPVDFDGAPARLVGSDGDYLSRSGFWQGGAGIAACWWGAAAGVSRPFSAKASLEPHAAAHLGAVDATLAASGALLRQTAAAIDAGAGGEALQLLVMRVRAVAEDAATEVIARTGRALGAGPLCRDRAHARRVADLEVFLRQSHAEQDLAVLGALAARTSREQFL